MTDAAPVLGNEAHGAEFFARVRRRLSLDVPAALRDPTAPAGRGDLDLDPESWTKAGVIASKTAAVLIAVVYPSAPTVTWRQRHADLPRRAGQIDIPARTS